MPRRTYKPEQIIARLRAAEVLLRTDKNRKVRPCLILPTFRPPLFEPKE